MGPALLAGGAVLFRISEAVQEFFKSFFDGRMWDEALLIMTGKNEVVPTFSAKACRLGGLGIGIECECNRRELTSFGDHFARRVSRKAKSHETVTQRETRTVAIRSLLEMTILVTVLEIHFHPRRTTRR